jgi:hypothetical protein
MLVLLFSLFTHAEEPTASITVTDSRYEEIYFEEPRVMCSAPCSFEQDTSIIFVEANRHHKAWLKTGKVMGVYNDETIKYAYEDCNFKQNPHGCANENGIWVMRTTISIDAGRASINIMLFDDTATMIGQGTYSKFKKTRIIERKKVTQQQVPGVPGSISNCNKADGSCATIPFQGSGQTVNQSEDLEPIVIDIPPTLTARDIGQTMIMVYDSVR